MVRIGKQAAQALHDSRVGIASCIVKPVQCLHDAHAGTASPMETARRGRLEVYLQVAELDWFEAGIGVNHDSRRYCVRQAKIVRCGHAVDKNSSLVAAC